MYQMESTVRFSEADQNGQLNMYTLLNYFQDCSTQQSETLNVGVEALHQKNLVWVVSTWNIQVNRFPALGEKIIVGTFPYDYRAFFGRRNFLMKTADGEILAMADSLWTLLNYETNTPETVTDDIIAGFEMEEKLPMDYIKGRISRPKDMVKLADILVMPYHLDANMHVNNGRYLQMALPYLPSIPFTGFRAEYRKMVRLGDTLSIFGALASDNDIPFTLIFKNSEDEITTIMEFTK